MIDSHSRVIRDLRISITDRCNFRCVYCMEPDVRFMPAAELLSVDEIYRLARVAVGLGVQKLRITGGEPTLHPELLRIISSLASTGVNDIAMTTNGWHAEVAALESWRAAGLRRLTVSIDSLDPARFQQITRSKSTPDDVIRTIRNAKAAGFDPVKINAVVVRGWNEEDVPLLAALALSLIHI